MKTVALDRGTFFERFAGWFAPARILALARSTRWLIRQGKIDAFEFLVGLVFGQMSSLGLSLSAHAGCFTEPVKREAVHQRYNEAAVKFLEGSFQECLRQGLEQSPQPSLTQALAEHFGAIHAVDSTSFDCPESLADLYPGCGGAASAANCKVLLRYEYLRSQFEPLALLPGKRSDPGLADRLPEIVQAGELLLTDKGFSKVEAMQRIDAKGAFFLLPWCRGLSLWLAPTPEGRQALDLARVLAHSQEPVLSWSQVYLGKGADAPAFRLVNSSRTA